MRICPSGEHGKQKGKYCLGCGGPTVDVPPWESQGEVTIYWQTLRNEECECGQKFSYISQPPFCPNCGRYIMWKLGVPRETLITKKES